MGYLAYLVFVLVFLAVMLLVGAVYFNWQSRGAGAGRVARRLLAMNTASDDAQKTVSITKERLLSSHAGVQGLLEWLPGVATLDRLLLQSGKNWNVGQLLGYSLLAWLLGLVLATASPLPWYLRLLLCFACGALPFLLVTRAKASRQARIELQLPDALDMMSRAMRAGHAFPTALKMVGDEMTGPLADEFRAVFDEVNFGVSMADALSGLAARVPSTDLRYFVIAVLIQRETGGNLTELLGSISAIIRDRLKLMGQVRVLSAEGRMSAWVLGSLPFAAALMMQLTNPEFLSVLYLDSGGRKMVGIALAMLAMGVLVIRRIVRIRV